MTSVLAGVSELVFDTGGKIKPVMLAEDSLPRSASLTVTVDRRLVSQGNMATAPYHWSFPCDGIRFMIRIMDESGEEREGFELWIDPKNNTVDRRWHHFSVDWSAYMGQTVEMVLTVESGADPVYDHAAWADLRLTTPEGH